MSDLHIEFWQGCEDRFISNVVDSTPESDAIVLAGDIGMLNTTYGYISYLLDALSARAKTVIYIPGNHEYYSDSYSNGKARLYKLRFAVPKNVVVCHEAFHQIEVDKYTICAGTLWFPDMYPEAYLKGYLADFSQIVGLEPAIYKDNWLFVKSFESVCKDKNNVIMATHHSPTYSSTHPKYAGSAMNQFFCNDLDGIIKDCKPKLMLHGHLHDAVDYTMGDTRIISNPAGYPSEILKDWEPKTIELN
jgi:predicted phosphohydrolase